MKTLKCPVYVVWYDFSGDHYNSPTKGICFKGRNPYYTHDYEDACKYKNELLNSNQDTTYIVVELKEIEE